MAAILGLFVVALLVSDEVTTDVDGCATPIGVGFLPRFGWRALRRWSVGRDGLRLPSRGRFRIRLLCDSWFRFRERRLGCLAIGQAQSSQQSHGCEYYKYIAVLRPLAAADKGKNKKERETRNSKGIRDDVNPFVNNLPPCLRLKS